MTVGSLALEHPFATARAIVNRASANRCREPARTIARRCSLRPAPCEIGSMRTRLEIPVAGQRLDALVGDGIPHQILSRTVPYEARRVQMLNIADPDERRDVRWMAVAGPLTLDHAPGWCVAKTWATFPRSERPGTHLCSGSRGRQNRPRTARARYGGTRALRSLLERPQSAQDSLPISSTRFLRM